jgi:hypothetical protein
MLTRGADSDNARHAIVYRRGPLAVFVYNTGATCCRAAVRVAL